MSNKIDFNSIENELSNLLLEQIKEKDITYGDVYSALDDYSDSADCDHDFYEFARRQVSRCMNSRKV